MMSYNILQALIIFVIIFESGISKAMFMLFHCPAGTMVILVKKRPETNPVITPDHAG